jgi:hypothetical protein
MTAARKITGLGFDENFGGIDLSGCPSAQGMPKDQSFIDERFAPLDATGSGHGSNALKRFIEEHAAEQEGATVVHVGDNEFRIFFKDGQYHADGEAHGKRRRYSAPDRDALYAKLMKLAAKPTAIRQLTEAQLLEVARIAGSGDRVGAINTFLEHAIPEALAERYDDPHQIVNDPTLRSFMDDVCEYVWLNSRLDATDSDDWQDWKARFVGQRPVSCALLDNAWEAFTDKRNRLVFADLPRTQEQPPESAPTISDLENLTDDEIAAQMKQQAKYNAHRPRAPYPDGHAFLEAEAAAVHA